MATNTYVELDARTLASATSSVTFTSISQAYTDLILVVNAAVTSGTCNVTMTFGDTSSLYSRVNLIGNGTNVTSTRQNNEALTYICTVTTTQTTAGTAQIMNYSNTTTFKTTLMKDAYPAASIIQRVNLWRNTNAISTIVIGNDGGTNFAIGSTFTLYGIAAEGIAPAPKATGGAIYDDELYYYHAFGATGVFTPNQSITADILVVAGGGAGGGSQGGGGGAGGLLGFASQSLTATNYTCTVGGGGTGVSASYNGGPGNNGTNSTFQGLTAAVGGGGGASAGNGANGVGSGGSGGGRANTSGAGTGTTGQGSAGGSTGTAGAKGGGGASQVGGQGLAGGAAGGNGATFNSTVGGTAGPYSFINAMGAATGTGELSGGNYYYAGGGAGGCDVEPAGLGGGGLSTIAGRASSGGGGGGACGNPGAGGNGGSGVIIVRYLKA